MKSPWIKDEDYISFIFLLYFHLWYYIEKTPGGGGGGGLNFYDF